MFWINGKQVTEVEWAAFVEGLSTAASIIMERFRDASDPTVDAIDAIIGGQFYLRSTPTDTAPRGKVRFR